ncbi:MAG: four helix bundle protein [Opitutaceae bacterium]|nr:four helix bundle protein [Opitutaceae bacterium]
MTDQFNHERLKVYQEALRFVTWVGPIIEDLPAKLAARDQLDRASTSIVLNLAEGNGKRSYPDRCRYFDIARGSVVECAACLDVLGRRGKLNAETVAAGKAILLEVVAMTAGLIARFSDAVHEEQAPFEDGILDVDQDKDKD